MNESKEFLAFSVGEMRIPPKHEDKLVTQEVWANLVAKVKAECHGKFGLCTCFWKLVTFFFKFVV
jgi:hypothetical protein